MPRRSDDWRSGDCAGRGGCGGGLPAAGRCRCGSMRRRCAALIAAAAEAAEQRLDPAAGRDGAGGVVRCRRRSGRGVCCWRSIILRWTGCRGGSWCRTWRRPGHAVAAGQAIVLPARGTSFRRWAERLAAHARERGGDAGAFVLARDAERAVAAAGGRTGSIRRATRWARAGHLTLTLPAAVTQALLTRVPAAFHGGINDVLLTGLALAVADWCRRHVQGAGVGARAGAQATRCCSIWRGMVARRSWPRGGVRRRRPDADGGLVHQPLSGAARSGPARSGGGACRGRGARACAQDHQGAVARGAGQGAGLWAAALSQRRDGGGSWPGLPAPQLGFNYLGRFAAGGDGADWSPAGLAGSAARAAGALGGGDPAMPLAHLIEINALTLDGADGPRLTAHWTLGAGAARTRRRCAIWRESWFGALDGAGAACRRSPAPAAARRAILRWSS